MVIKAGICVAYDWDFLKYSLPSIYSYMDAICLSVDVNRQSWNGNVFEIDWNAFRELIAKIDTDSKITVLEHSFFQADKTPIDNECYQRKMMADHLGESDWLIQIDTDEIIINIVDFIKILEKNKNSKRSLNIHGIWLNLIKQTSQGFIYSSVKTPPLATNMPLYEYGRTNGHFNIYSNIFLIHITWARAREEVYFKLKNWGHSHEFNSISFYKIWDALDDHNWIYIKDFHPMNKSSIPQLYYEKAGSYEEFLKSVDLSKHALSYKQLLLNNIWFSRLNKLIR